MLTKTFFISLLASVATANPAPQNSVNVGAITSAVAALPLASQSALLSKLSSYEASIAKDPMYTSALAVVATAVPASDIAKAAADPSGYIQSALSATTTPAWYKSLPTQYQSYFNSIGSAQLSIVAEATNTGAKSGMASATNAGSNGNNAGATGAAGMASATGSAAASASNAAGEKMAKGVKFAAAGFGGLVAGILAL